MKPGLTITQLAERLENQAKAKRDLVVASPRMRLSADHASDSPWTGQTTLEIEGEDTHATTPLFRRQLTARLKIPAAYFSRMEIDAPGLLADNVNHWLIAAPERRMVRTLAGDGAAGKSGTARAYLSDRYKRVDNVEVLEQMLPAFSEIEGIQVSVCELTETRMYVKVLLPRVQGEVRKGDVVQAGALLTNSEVGLGALSVTPLLMRLVCLNGMVMPDGRFRAFHTGRKADGEDEVYEMLTDEARAADEKALLLRARDVTAKILSPDYFASQLVKMQEAANDQLTTKRPDKAVEVMSRTVGITGEEQVGVLTHLLQGRDLSRWGFANAVTRAAQDVESYDRSVQLETVGSRVLQLSHQEWRAMEEAA